MRSKPAAKTLTEKRRVEKSVRVGVNRKHTLCDNDFPEPTSKLIPIINCRGVVVEEFLNYRENCHLRGHKHHASVERIGNWRLARI